MVLIATIGSEMDWLEPGARYSNRLPVKAKGLVRLRSPGSVGSVGRVSTPMCMTPLPFDDVAAPAESSAKVAEMSLDALEHNKMRVVPGTLSKAMSVAGGYSPRALVAPIVGTFYKRLGPES